MSTVLTGCAALTNPIQHGTPVALVPKEFLASPKEPSHPLPVSLLGQNKPAVYRLGPGDTLGVWIEGILSSPTQGPPIYHPPGQSEIGPVLGYPIPVREDGTVALPLVSPIDVTGMTINEAEDAIRKAYTVTKTILQPGRDRTIVTLLRRRSYHVIVFRDEAQNFNNPGAEAATVVLASTQKRGNAHTLELPAGENDVLNALGRSGGPPGIDAYNEVVVEHKKRPATEPLANCAPRAQLPMVPHQMIRIPLALLPGEEPPFKPEDLILDDGDVVYVEARPVERFYTGGLLPPGQFILPRDYDLDVIQAIAFVQGPLVNGGFGGFGGTGIAGTTIAPGIGGPSPSLATILRRTPDGELINIRVDLKSALCNPRERILIKAGDVLILQETPLQAIARYAASFIDKVTFNFSFQRVTNTGVTTGTSVVRPPGP